jgi:hypothetical protein
VIAAGSVPGSIKKNPFPHAFRALSVLRARSRRFRVHERGVTLS